MGARGFGGATLEMVVAAGFANQRRRRHTHKLWKNTTNSRLSMSMARIREATGNDAAAVAAIYAPYCDSSAISFEIEAPSPDEIRTRIEKVLPKYPWLVCETEDHVVGYAYASRHRERAAYRWTVDVGIYIADDQHRRGIGRALYCSLFSLIVQQGYFKAYAGITLPNDASVGLHLAMGFSEVGTYPAEGFKLGAGAT